MKNLIRLEESAGAVRDAAQRTARSFERVAAADAAWNGVEAFPCP